MPRVLVLSLSNDDLDGFEYVDDVVDAAALHAELGGSLVQGDELLLAGAVQVQKVLAQQAEAVVDEGLGGGSRRSVEKFFFESVGSALGVSRLRSREKYAGGGEGSRARVGNCGWETRGSVCSCA